MPGPTILTIGNFDGVHRGHAALIAAARAPGLGPGFTPGHRPGSPTGPGNDGHGPGRVVALVFDPHPLMTLRPEAAPTRLSTFDQRVQWLTEAGADAVVPLRPSAELLNQSPEEFVAALVDRYNPRAIVEGEDFRFGKGRSGTVQELRELGDRFGFETIVVGSVEAALSDHSAVRVSSSMIRWLIERGRVGDAASLLGRAYELRGVVVAGDQRGRTIGVPTANLAPTDQLLPADGIYAGWAVRPDGRGFPAAVSVGTKPTFGVHPRVCEAHLIGYQGPLDEYGWEIRVQFHRWLRDQLVYQSIEALADQLRRDIKASSAPMGVGAGGAGVAGGAGTAEPAAAAVHA